jgi:histone H3/H4
MKQELIELDDLFRKCPYSYTGDSNNGYNCVHPDCEDLDEDTNEGRCFHFNCPIGYIPRYDEVLKHDKDLAEEMKDDLEDDSAYIDVTWLLVNKNEYGTKKIHENFTRLIKEVYLKESGINKIRKDAISHLVDEFNFDYGLPENLQGIIQVAIAHAVIQRRKTLMKQDFEVAINMSRNRKGGVWVNSTDIKNAKGFMKMVLGLEKNRYREKIVI